MSIEPFKLQDALDTATLTQGWEILDEAATCYIADGKCHLHADLAYTGDVDAGAGGTLGELHAGYAPAFAQAGALLNFNKAAPIWLTSWVDGDPATLAFSLQGGPLPASPDGKAYVTLDIEYLLASAVVG